MQKGFTLLETLVALAIIGTALLAVLSLTANSVATTSKLKERYAAELVAENTIRQIRMGLITVPSSPYQYTNNNVMFNKTWHIMAYTTSTHLPTALQIYVKVRATEKDTPLVTLNSYIAVQEDKD